MLQVATVRFLDGAHAGQMFVLTEAKVVIGSGAACSICCRDPGIADEHAWLVLEDDETRWLEQRDGPTLVNGRSNSRTKLRDGDVLIFASGAIARFEYRDVVAVTDSTIDRIVALDPHDPG